MSFEAQGKTFTDGRKLHVMVFGDGDEDLSLLRLFGSRPGVTIVQVLTATTDINHFVTVVYTKDPEGGNV